MNQEKSINELKVEVYDKSQQIAQFQKAIQQLMNDINALNVEIEKLDKSEKE